MSAPQAPQDPRDPIFKGCTRPAMVYGVPTVPLAIVVMVVVLISVWTTVLLAFTLIPIFLVMRVIAKHDDQQFRLLGLKILFRANNRNRRFWKSSTYSPFQFKKRK
ncbi:type IV secretion system protein VirB3 [Pseudomonas syringae]|uniref:Type IV secretion system protein VirB3 n=1 Tax=Pseudomonas syringae pv. persicae TaxID=237306 RepID=A0A3M4AI61_9PSED|nr:VirB3 family type IV secretion system protein [Pseudomonas syringae]QOQ33523.1 Inner membrane protein forms channel for type IV secretion of T-DNA complex, VirB3 [Pseudomonas syringae pv. actinidiae]RMP06559.1 hypothetical protein ALQ30_200635 [Pseudomonas syringae pv. persicae]